MIRKTFAVGPLGCNCTILADEASRETVVIDPGDDVPRVLAALREADLKVVGIVHTHAHIDHIGGTADLAEATGAPTYLHEEDRFLHDILPQQAMMIGLPPVPRGTIDRVLTDGGSIRFGAHELGVLHTPGHTPGSVCFTLAGAELCFSGDTLFAGGVGRTDLWGGDSTALIRSIRNRLYTLNSAVEVIPGHGPLTSIDRERTTNPFVRG